MRISILTPDFSHNCFGRAWLLAKLLQSNFEIEMIGPAFGDGIWKPLRDECDFHVKIVQGYRNGRFEFKKLLRIVTGDVIYASKPLMASFGVGLVKKLLSRKPLLLDIDDWELTDKKPYYDSLIWPKKINDFLLSIRNWRSFHYAIILDKFIPLSDAITVSGPLLQAKYNGSVLWHARDTNFLDPGKYDSKELRRQYLKGVPYDTTIVAFIGTPRAHKGLDDIIDAFELLKDKNFLLMIVGMANDSYCNSLKTRIESSCLKDVTVLFGEQPFKKLPEFLSMADIIVIPQNRGTVSWGQIPAKLFDAMSMAKPIITTDVPGISEIISGCGWVIDSQNPDMLAETILYISRHSDEAKYRAKKARKKIIANFSMDIASYQAYEFFKTFSKSG